ncbi:transcriptional regulator, partial [Streptomyces clavuligerus]
MRIGELSRRTGVPVPTIKYYVREGLVPAGRLTSPNQADYGEVHEQRLRLIRALLDVGGLKVAAVADVLVAVDDPGLPEHKVLGVATDLLVSRYPEEEPDVALEAARARVDELIERRGWRVGAACPGRESLAVALASL